LGAADGDAFAADVGLEPEVASGLAGGGMDESGVVARGAEWEDKRGEVARRPGAAAAEGRSAGYMPLELVVVVVVGAGRLSGGGSGAESRIIMGGEADLVDLVVDPELAAAGPMGSSSGGGMGAARRPNCPRGRAVAVGSGRERGGGIGADGRSH
jgi:hypothetical protein